ncbi:MAG: WYL domain-containing protein [Pyramidobacter sp.]|jgi:hypothetical protein
MAYSELVKNFNRIRDYMREFYVYGFKSRSEYTRKSARSYDNERRRMESWLGDSMGFRRTPEGKNVFISIDSRLWGHNPLYKAWKTKSFSDGDITLHFLIFDILSDPAISLTVAQITERLDKYLSQFSATRTFDESTVRKKLKEYAAEGLLIVEKKGRTRCYRRSGDDALLPTDALDYFSEVLPCGVIGSFLLDRTEPHEKRFAFKHHYITGAMDSEVICSIFEAIAEKRSVTLECLSRRKERSTKNRAVPLKVMVSVQNGRQYLMAFVPRFKRIMPFRIDFIVSMKTGEPIEGFDELLHDFEAMRPHMWSVSTQNRKGNRIEHVEFTVRYGDDEQHIKNRLEREKRCGTVTHLDAHRSRFSADIYDARELIPWIRTFICRIVDVHFSNATLEKQFRQDLKDLYALYGLEGED